MKPVAVLVVCALRFASLSAQDAKAVQPAPHIVLCADEAPECSHRLVNGFTYKTLVTPTVSVTMSLGDNGKFTRADVMVTNTGQSHFDVVPSSFVLTVTEPKAKLLRMVPPEKIIASEQHGARWANALNAMGAGMATQQVTTQTTASGTVQANGNDGSSANGTYNGTSNSTTSVPDYAARARARENIAKRQQAIAAHQTELEHTVLRANTLDAGNTLGGFVFFESEKHGEMYVLDIPIDGTIYRFPFARPKH